MKITDQIAPGHMYGCSSEHPDNKGKPAQPRGRTRVSVLNSHIDSIGYDMSEQIQIAAPVTTDWAPIACGHNLRVSDPSCTGCANREREE